jgi:hypothetical protein
MADTMPDLTASLTETEYANHVLPAREAPYEVAAILVACLAILFAIAGIVGVLATSGGIAQLQTLVARPWKAGFLSIGLAALALAFAGPRDRMARFAMVFATVCWLAGGLIAVVADVPVW